MATLVQYTGPGSQVVGTTARIQTGAVLEELQRTPSGDNILFEGIVITGLDEKCMPGVEGRIDLSRAQMIRVHPDELKPVTGWKEAGYQALAAVKNLV